MGAADLLASIRQLPQDEKLALVDQILASIDPPDAAIEAAWFEEAKRRVRAYQGGEMRAMPVAEFIASRRKLA